MSEYGEGIKYQRKLQSRQGKWIKDNIQKISRLLCTFGPVTDDHTNGIYIHKEKGDFQFDEEIAHFLCFSYIEKKRTINSSNMIIITSEYENIIMEACGDGMDEELIQSITIILNHLEFKGCKNIQEIKDRIHKIKEF